WEEALDVIVGAWTTDVFSWEGTHFHVPPRRVLPKPLQKPHPPLWMASTSPASHEIAGRKGLGLLSFTIGVPPEELASRIALYRSGLKEARPAGKFVNDRAATVMWYFRRSIELIGSVAAWQEGRELGTYDYTRMLRALNLSDVTFPLLDDMDAVIVGDPETCIRKVKRYREAGCDQLLCLMQPYDIAPDAVTRSIELFGRYVIPAF